MWKYDELPACDRFATIVTVSTLYKFMKKLPLNMAGLSDTYVKGKMTKFFAFTMEILDLFLKLPVKLIASLLLCGNMANSGSNEAIKR
jgi:hypothetical protein